MPSITLPYGVSVNRAYWHRGSIRYLTTEAKAFKKEVERLAIEAGLTPMDGEIALTVHIYRPRRRGDTSNRLKLAEDALKGYAWHDDEQVAKLIVERFDTDKKNPRLEIAWERRCE